MKKKLKFILYNSAVYNGRVAYFKKGNMQGKVSIFTSGKLISVGTKSEQKSFHELEMAINYLVEKGLIQPIPFNPKTQNIVVTADFGSSLNLAGLAFSSSNVIYEPEQFPAATLRLKEPIKTTILIFASGKAVINGLRSSTQIEPIMKYLKHFIEINQ